MKTKEKKISIKELVYSNKGAFHSILAFKDHLTTFKYQGKDYDDMFRYIKANYDYYDDETTLGRPSDVQKALGYSYSKFKRILRLLFDDMHAYLGSYGDYWDIPSSGLKMKEALMVYRLKNHGEVLYFKIHGDFRIPNVGDSIDFNVLHPMIGSTMFDVDHISHEIDNTKYIINVYCTASYENRYFEWAKDLEY